MAITRPVTKTLISTSAWGVPITDEVNALRTELNALKPTPWADISLMNGFTWESPFQKPQYRKVGDQVYVRAGLYIPNGTAAVLFQLPVGFRPLASLRYFGNAFRTGAGGLYSWRGLIDSGGQFTIEEWSPVVSPQNMTLSLTIDFSTI